MVIAAAVPVLPNQVDVFCCVAKLMAHGWQAT